MLEKRQDPESGSVSFFDTATGAIAYRDPYPDSLGGLLTFGAPILEFGGEGGSTAFESPNLMAVGGFPLSAFAPVKGPDMAGPSGEVGNTILALNPLTGKYERGWILPDQYGAGVNGVVPEYFGRQIPGAGAYVGQAVKDGGFDWQTFLQVAAVVAPFALGVTGVLGAAAGSGGAAAAGAAEALSPYELAVSGAVASGPAGFGAITGAAAAGAGAGVITDYELAVSGAVASGPADFGAITGAAVAGGAGGITDYELAVSGAAPSGPAGFGTISAAGAGGLVGKAVDAVKTFATQIGKTVAGTAAAGAVNKLLGGTVQAGQQGAGGVVAPAAGAQGFGSVLLLGAAGLVGFLILNR